MHAHALQHKSCCIVYWNPQTQGARKPVAHTRMYIYECIVAVAVTRGCTAAAAIVSVTFITFSVAVIPGYPMSCQYGM